METVIRVVILIVPPTSKTMIRFAFDTASRKDPVPESLFNTYEINEVTDMRFNTHFRFVTWYTDPVLPPTAFRPNPSAPGKARSPAALGMSVANHAVARNLRITIAVSVTK